MNRKLRILCIFFLTCLNLQAQNTELGILAGAANYLGELAPDIALNETKLAGGLFVRNRLSRYFALRHNLILGRVSGNDANFEFNQLRNLSFRTNVFEISSIVEFNFLPFGTQKQKKERAFTSYVFVGLGLFKFNPKSQFGTTKWVELKSLGTEGQGLNGGKGYSLLSISIPFGMGVKYNLSKKWGIGMELGFRRTYTDYLDDVSTKYPDFIAAGQPQAMTLSDRSGEVNGGKYLAAPGDIRGNPTDKDWYIFSTITLSFRIIKPEVCKGNFY
jgi:hypothetical protein